MAKHITVRIDVSKESKGYSATACYTGASSVRGCRIGSGTTPTRAISASLRKLAQRSLERKSYKSRR